jgi:hypothetical protein
MLKVLMEISQPNLSQNQQEGQQGSRGSSSFVRKEPGEPKPATAPAPERKTEEGALAEPENTEKVSTRRMEASESSSVSGEHTDREEEGMVLVGRPSKSG